MAKDRHALSSDENWLRCKLKQHCLFLASLERTIAHLRSRVHYVKERDANTSFHKQAGFQKRKNFIAKLVDGDRVVNKQEDKHQVLFNHFEGVLGQARNRSGTFELTTFHRAGIDLSDLDIFRKRKIWATIQTLPADRAPGPDGLLAVFTNPAGQ